jgi:hypothetical protein
MEDLRRRVGHDGIYARNIGALIAHRDLPARGPLAAASDDLDRLGLLIETTSPRDSALHAEARGLATVGPGGHHPGARGPGGRRSARGPADRAADGP